jgi:hypothetical protein
MKDAHKIDPCVCPICHKRFMDANALKSHQGAKGHGIFIKSEENQIRDKMAKYHSEKARKRYGLITEKEAKDYGA